MDELRDISSDQEEADTKMFFVQNMVYWLAHHPFVFTQLLQMYLPRHFTNLHM